ncbi:hypothetical protein [Klebsiella pneumoniae]|uniref:hypothetical protein n=1 Tax=Klebsiella pneumoniae TaxID=573 RepID=UPI00388D3A54
MKMGMAGLNVVVDSWLTEWKFKEKISDLLDNGFEVIITSDHGNQEAIGMGYINEGVKAETRGNEYEFIMTLVCETALLQTIKIL